MAARVAGLASAAAAVAAPAPRTDERPGRGHADAPDVNEPSDGVGWNAARTRPRTRVRIGVLVVHAPSSGGMHQYELSILDALSSRARELSDRFSFALFYLRGDRLPLERLRGSGWATHALPSRRALELVRSVACTAAVRRLARRRKPRASPAPTQAFAAADRGTQLKRFLLGRFFRHHGIDLLLCPTALSVGVEAGLPVIMAIHDLQHRLHPEFPEVSAGGEWERRERLYLNAARHATLLVADSDTGSEDIVDCYGVSPDRVAVLPFVPPPYLHAVSSSEADRIRREQGLPERFFFYPAQFWPHKNHVRVVEAIGLLKREHALDVHVAFTGSPHGGITADTASEIAEAAEQHGCADQIHRLGYLSGREVSALYGTATGLVMPTFFGPTNIPIVEAWLLGCPVLTSDIRGVREQVGDGGLLVDPADPRAIADGMRRLATDEALRGDLRRRGSERLALYTAEDFARRLTEILDTGCDLVAAGDGRGPRRVAA